MLDFLLSSFLPRELTILLPSRSFSSRSVLDTTLSYADQRNYAHLGRHRRYEDACLGRCQSATARKTAALRRLRTQKPPTKHCNTIINDRHETNGNSDIDQSFFRGHIAFLLAKKRYTMRVLRQHVSRGPEHHDISTTATLGRSTEQPILRRQYNLVYRCLLHER